MILLHLKKALLTDIHELTSNMHLHCHLKSVFFNYGPIYSSGLDFFLRVFYGRLVIFTSTIETLNFSWCESSVNWEEVPSQCWPDESVDLKPIVKSNRKGTNPKCTNIMQQCREFTKDKAIIIALLWKIKQVAEELRSVTSHYLILRKILVRETLRLYKSNGFSIQLIV